LLQRVRVPGDLPLPGGEISCDRLDVVAFVEFIAPVGFDLSVELRECGIDGFLDLPLRVSVVRRRGWCGG